MFGKKEKNEYDDLVQSCKDAADKTFSEVSDERDFYPPSDNIFEKTDQSMYNANRYGYNYDIPARAGRRPNGGDPYAAYGKKNIYGGTSYGGNAYPMGRRDEMDTYYNRAAGLGQRQNAAAPQDEETAKSYTMPESFGGAKTSVTYENVGFFARVLNLFVMLSAICVIAMGMVKILGDNNIDIDGTVGMLGVRIQASVAIMAVLHLFVSVIWLLCFVKPAKIITVIFSVFVIFSVVFGQIHPAIIKDEKINAIFVSTLYSSAVVMLIMISMIEQYVRSARGFALFFGALCIASIVLSLAVGQSYIKLPSAVSKEKAVSILAIFSMSVYTVLYLCLNVLWRKRIVK